MHKIILPNENLLCCKTGFINTRDIKIGDGVLNHDGLADTVINCNSYESDIYKISFTDDTKILISQDSKIGLMSMYEKKYKKNFKNRDIRTIKEKYKTGEEKCIFRIKMCNPINFDNVSQKISTYITGCLIGDGNISSQTCIDISNKDDDVLAKIKKHLPDDLILIYANQYNYRFRGKIKCKNIMYDIYREYDLLDKKSYNKFIPKILQKATLEERIELLYGLIDTDGCIAKRQNGDGRVIYSTISQNLAEDVVLLVQSLGGTATISKRTFTEKDNHYYKGHLIKHNYPLYTINISININPASCQRKKNNYTTQNPKRLIKNIEYVKRSQCTEITLMNKQECITNNYVCI